MHLNKNQYKYFHMALYIKALSKALPTFLFSDIVQGLS